VLLELAVLVVATTVLPVTSVVLVMSLHLLTEALLEHQVVQVVVAALPRSIKFSTLGCALSPIQQTV
jgi:hypothetical protein